MVVFIVSVLALSPVVLISAKKAPLIESISNAKQIYYLLVDFDQEYGAFPNDETARSKPELNRYRGEYSNDYLGQLFAAGYTNSEEVFYAKEGSLNQHRPDDDISTRSKVLEGGECGFAYIKGLGTDSHLETPVLLASMYGDGYKFNTEAFEGRSMALRVDGRAKQYHLDENHHALLSQTREITLFDGGKDTVWGEKGFAPENLCYAKYPYEYKKRLKSNHKLMIGCLILLIVIGISVLIWRRNSKKSKVIT